MGYHKENVHWVVVLIRCCYDWELESMQSFFAHQYSTSINRNNEEVMLMEEINWRQKSRATWICEGDWNTKFIHCMANFHRCNNFTRKLQVGDHLSTD